MKKVLAMLVSLVVIGLSTFLPQPVFAQQCTGESTGQPGDCALFCGPNRRGDGNTGCPLLQRCCVDTGGENLPCTGESTSLPGVCASICGPNRRGDGNTGCVGIQRCCVDTGGENLPCTGESSGGAGVCATICGPFRRGDGNTGCVGAQRCCVPVAAAPGPVKSPLGGGTCGSNKLDTAIGCIPISGGQEFIAFILGWGIGIGGGIAFLLILYAGFMITTSSGDPKKLQAGRELLTAAIAGLLLLIFSVFILRLIGFTILRLPGFGS